MTEHICLKLDIQCYSKSSKKSGLGKITFRLFFNLWTKFKGKCVWKNVIFEFKIRKKSWHCKAIFTFQLFFNLWAKFKGKLGWKYVMFDWLKDLQFLMISQKIRNHYNCENFWVIVFSFKKPTVFNNFSKIIGHCECEKNLQINFGAQRAHHF